nr:MAG TPA: hypothetical protein [Caudoviricetes sp.]
MIFLLKSITILLVFTNKNDNLKLMKRNLINGLYR